MNTQASDPDPLPLPDIESRLGDVAPGLHAKLSVGSAEEYEQASGAVLTALKDHRVTTMLIPTRWHGGGASALDAVRFQVALGSLAPSVAIATTMHHYKIAALGNVAASGDTAARTVLADIVSESMLLASGGAESTPGRDLRTLQSWAVRDGDDYLVTGLKRPCSLSSSMNMMSLMVELREPDGTFIDFAQAFVPAATEGLERATFWRSPVFGAAESHSVRLTNVRIPQDHVFALRGEVGTRFATDCYLWFQLLISSAYLGIACCVAEATPAPRRQRTHRWTAAMRRLHRLDTVLQDAARAVDAGRPVADQLNLAVRARDQVEDEVAEIGGQLLRAAGGGSFAGSGFHTTLAGALNAIAFHPPARGSRDGIGLELLDHDLKGRD